MGITIFDIEGTTFGIKLVREKDHQPFFDWKDFKKKEVEKTEELKI